MMKGGEVPRSVPEREGHVLLLRRTLFGGSGDSENANLIREMLIRGEIYFDKYISPG